MRIQKLIKIIIITILAMFISNVSNAYTITAPDITAKEGEEFTVVINVDVNTPLANGRIKFDSSKLEYVGKTQELMNASESEEGTLSWIYVDLYGEGTKSFEFKFKVKEDSATTLTLEDLAIVDIDGNQYTTETISGNKTINVNKSKFSVIFVVIIAVIVIGILFILAKKRKK